MLSMGAIKQAHTVMLNSEAMAYCLLPWSSATHFFNGTVYDHAEGAELQQRLDCALPFRKVLTPC